MEPRSVSYSSEYWNGSAAQHMRQFITDFEFTVQDIVKDATEGDAVSYLYLVQQMSRILIDGCMELKRQGYQFGTGEGVTGPTVQ